MSTPAIIHPSSTVMLLRDSARGLEVLMVRRHHAIDFAGGALVFPGGKATGGDSDPALAKLMRSSPLLGEAVLPFAVAALREAFEEAGVLLARPEGSETLVSAERVAALAPYRKRLETDEVGMAAFLSRERLELALDLLVPFARWITPELAPRRFDTWFFAAMAPADQIARHDGGESVDSVWLRPADALADADAKRRTILFPTRLNLMKLGAHADTEAALAAARLATIVTVRPTVDMTAPGGPLLRIPAEAGYGLTEFPLARARGG